MEPFPYPGYHRDSFAEVYATFLPMCTVISFVMLCPAILKRVVEEKDSGVEVCLFVLSLLNNKTDIQLAICYKDINAVA
jgi:hypothetical protein